MQEPKITPTVHLVFILLVNYRHFLLNHKIPAVTPVSEHHRAVQEKFMEMLSKTERLSVTVKIKVMVLDSPPLPV